ncbi:hypothetical protein KP509_25G000100 [Ceratopteris richardii]|uniref:LOB domain-containing protein n=1 Tax=Ceratopteris richardii TaxID=49495 RepID=A0A8T2RP00_CERRI|nr:hypothetical protein KP509_25G000100 [Ceratopteris richardii]
MARPSPATSVSSSHLACLTPLSPQPPTPQIHALVPVKHPSHVGALVTCSLNINSTGISDRSTEAIEDNPGAQGNYVLSPKTTALLSARQNATKNTQNSSHPPVCAACRYQRRRCPKDCELAKYFSSVNDDEAFICVHQLFGVRNFLRLLEKAPNDLRPIAGYTMKIEAAMRHLNPVYGPLYFLQERRRTKRILEAELKQLQLKLQNIKMYQQLIIQENARAEYSSQQSSPSSAAFIGASPSTVPLTQGLAMQHHSLSTNFETAFGSPSERNHIANAEVDLRRILLTRFDSSIPNSSSYIDSEPEKCSSSNIYQQILENWEPANLLCHSGTTRHDLLPPAELVVMKESTPSSNITAGERMPSAVDSCNYDEIGQCVHEHMYAKQLKGGFGHSSNIQESSPICLEQVINESSYIDVSSSSTAHYLHPCDPLLSTGSDQKDSETCSFFRATNNINL